MYPMFSQRQHIIFSNRRSFFKCLPPHTMHRFYLLIYIEIFVSGLTLSITLRFSGSFWRIIFWFISSFLRTFVLNAVFFLAFFSGNILNKHQALERVWNQFILFKYFALFLLHMLFFRVQTLPKNVEQRCSYTEHLTWNFHCVSGTNAKIICRQCNVIESLLLCRCQFPQN